MHIAVGVSHTGHIKKAAFYVLPLVKVGLGKRTKGGYAGGPAGSGYEYDFRFGHGAHFTQKATDALCIPFSLLIYKGEFSRGRKEP